MGRRIEIELTSARDDGTWTWRAAGAREPRGVLDAALLGERAKVGDVLRVDAEFEIDGIVITAVLPPKSPRAEPERLEVIGSPRDIPPVTSTLLPKGERRGRDRDGDRPRRDDDRPRERGRERRREGERTPRAERAPRERPSRPPRSERAPRAPERSTTPSTAPARPRPKRLQPKRVHRDAVLESLAPEQRPVAEQVLLGGLPAVRQAVEDQNAQARASGQPPIRADALLAMAEELLPRLKAAEWLDRAEAAVARVDEIGLRDLRAIVVGAEGVARDEDTRALASTLRDALQRRSEAQREAWLLEIAQSLDEGRVVRALRTSSRPPEPGTMFPPDMATRLTEAAGGAMAADVAPDRWAAVLEAVVTSPVRKTVEPRALPAEPNEALLAAARQAAPRVPALAALLGIERPSVGAAGRPTRPPQPSRPPRPVAAPAAEPVPVPESTPEPARESTS
jgi:hypothetical protein